MDEMEMLLKTRAVVGMIRSAVELEQNAEAMAIMKSLGMKVPDCRAIMQGPIDEMLAAYKADGSDLASELEKLVRREMVALQVNAMGPQASA